jgi:uncharacterized repeat protein (TIGR01451 family)
VENTSVLRIPVWAVVALGLALATAVVAALAFGGRAANAATGADLRITKLVQPQTVTVGQNQTFTIIVKNQSSRKARNVKITDPLPAKVRFIRASTSLHRPGSCGVINRTVKCKPGTLKRGEKVTIDIIVEPVRAGRYTNRAFVTQKRADFAAQLGGVGAFGASTTVFTLLPRVGILRSLHSRGPAPGRQGR